MSRQINTIHSTCLRMVSCTAMGVAKGGICGSLHMTTVSASSQNKLHLTSCTQPCKPQELISTGLLLFINTAASVLILGFWMQFSPLLSHPPFFHMPDVTEVMPS